jgi:mannose-6-phosphate isomerase-like protein (cupin superfamily)
MPLQCGWQRREERAMGRRRIVTGFNAAGKSTIVDNAEMPPGAYGGADFWLTDASPAALLADGDPRPRPPRLEPPCQGTLFRFFEIPPEDPTIPREQVDQHIARLFAATGASHCRVDTTRHPLMHTTQTIDYVVLLRGEVTLLMDDGEVALQPFDVVVQRGTNHSWVNRGKEPALLAAVLVDARA